MKFTNMQNGLSLDEVNHIRLECGLNELPQTQPIKFWQRCVNSVKEPMVLLLVVTMIVYLLIGDLSEGLLLGVMVFVVIGISLYQERKSEKALEALRELSSPQALVIRNGVTQKISASELVLGDIVSLHEGDRVPADGLILDSINLGVDESLLTGEAYAVDKSSISLLNFNEENSREIDNCFKVFSSTLVIRGQALIQVTHVGLKTEVGKIGSSLKGEDNADLALSYEIKDIVKIFAWGGGAVCVLIVLLYGFNKHDWVQALLIGLSTQMALLPEEFPLVLTIFMTMGAWRLSKVNILTRRSGAIERLGSITVLCVDKTGTLTQNKMIVSALANQNLNCKMSLNHQTELTNEFYEVVKCGVLASQKDSFDPMENAIRTFATQTEVMDDILHQNLKIQKHYPLSEKLLAMSCAWSLDEQNNQIFIASKGAPEAILELCHLDEVRRNEILQAVREFAKNGLRVLGVAQTYWSGDIVPEDHHEFDFKFVGLIGLEDPLRVEVPDAVKICRSAGIKVIMMTGDYSETALKIAERAGIDINGSCLIGSHLKTIDDDALIEKLKVTHVFARMIPDQKLRIVKLLQRMGHVVAMTGDGVNDAPSLKWADVGISMGGKGTDVAREASDIVLLDDHFTSIVSGIVRGRTIFSNIKKAMSYIVSIHFPIAGLAILPVFFGWPLILLPAHIVFLELIIDPVCSLMFESHEPSKNTMLRPPRSLKEKLFTTNDLLRSSFQGLYIFCVTGLVFWLALIFESGSEKYISYTARTLTFSTLILSNIGLIFSDLSGGSLDEIKKLFTKLSNLVIIVLIVSVLIIGIQTSSMHDLLKLRPLTFLEYVFVFAVASLNFSVINIWNWLSRK